VILKEEEEEKNHRRKVFFFPQQAGNWLIALGNEETRVPVKSNPNPSHVETAKYLVVPVFARIEGSRPWQNERDDMGAQRYEKQSMID
jgi:hypothetical protein